MKEQSGSFTASTSKITELDYLIYFPSDYDPSAETGLLIFLHGMGERGHDLELVKIHGIAHEIEAGREFPLIVVAPQCPPDTFWSHEIQTLSAFLDQLEKDYRIDPNQIYLTGLSMGGYGTWWWALAEPNRFAAIAPICGGGDKWRADLIAHLPIRVFHGDRDEAVSPGASQSMVDALKTAGAKDVELTLYPGVGHDAWTQTYSSDVFYEWLFAQRRASR